MRISFPTATLVTYDDLSTMATRDMSRVKLPEFLEDSPTTWWLLCESILTSSDLISPPWKRWPALLTQLWEPQTPAPPLAWTQLPRSPPPPSCARPLTRRSPPRRTSASTTADLVPRQNGVAGGAANSPPPPSPDRETADGAAGAKTRVLCPRHRTPTPHHRHAGPLPETFPG